jgi:hypothetical protein
LFHPFHLARASMLQTPGCGVLQSPWVACLYHLLAPPEPPREHQSRASAKRSAAVAAPQARTHAPVELQELIGGEGFLARQLLLGASVPGPKPHRCVSGLRTRNPIRRHGTGSKRTARRHGAPDVGHGQVKQLGRRETAVHRAVFAAEVLPRGHTLCNLCSCRVGSNHDPNLSSPIFGKE